MRWAQHAAQQDWWPEVHTRTVVWYPTRRAARLAEDEAIALEHPLHNDPRAPRPARTPVSAHAPKYKHMARITGQFWPDQLTDLTELTRSLNRARGGRGERITDNTLIRLGADLLLSRAEELTGGTEGELCRSLGLPG